LKKKSQIKGACGRDPLPLGRTNQRINIHIEEKEKTNVMPRGEGITNIVNAPQYVERIWGGREKKREYLLTF